ncbi:MAG: PAS domain S-box protein [Candidatus Omnitrophica bacterium]|nr:PAS domain S-box protein [Candidatus Omnitrophota bacterium]
MRGKTRPRVSHYKTDLFRRVVDSSPDCISISTLAEGKFLYVNKAGSKIFGHARKEALGRTAKQLYIWDDPKDRLIFMDRVRKLGSVRDMEVTLRKRTGERFTAAISAGIIDAGGEKCLLIFTRDISERKKTEEALQVSEARYRVLLENIPQKIFLKDKNSIYISCNAIYARDLKIKPEEIIGKTDYDFYPKKLAKKYRKDDKSVMEAKRARGIEEKYIVAGKETWVYTVKTPVMDEKGGVAGILGIFYDITLRKKAEEDLGFRNILLSTQTEASIDGILVVDSRGKMISFNKRFVEMWGIPKEVARLRSDERALRSVRDKLADPEGFLRKVKYLYAHSQEKSRDEVILKDGRTFDRYSSPMFGKDKKYYGRIWYFRDITERKKSEEELFRAKRLSDIGTLAATVAHELRNPLATIRTAMFNIRRKSRDPRIEGHLESIEKKIVESNRIINDLLFYSRLRLPKIEPVKLWDIMDECISLSHERFKDYRVRLCRVCRIDKNAFIEADALMLKEMCHNILDNAYESLADKRGAIEVKAWPASRKGFISISVKDNGAGMGAESLKRLSEPFFTTKVRGTGLGFSICHQIVRLHNGTMDVASKKGKGTKVTVNLPVKQRKP